MLTAREIELELQALRKEHEQIKATVEQLLKTANQWVSINRAAELSNKKYSAHNLKRKIELAIASPSSTDLVEGRHFRKIVNDSGMIGSTRYKVLWPEFDLVWTKEQQI
jgi:hypothetical protein